MTRLEFWPDYGGVLLHDRGAAVALDGLGLPGHLVEQAAAWVAEYADAKLDPDSRDDAWINAGRSLFRRLRAELRDRGIEIVDWEGYWDDPGTMSASG